MHVGTSECMARIHLSECPYIVGIAHTLGDGLKIGAPMGPDMDVFQVADAPMYGYIYTLPFLFFHFSLVSFN